MHTYVRTYVRSVLLSVLGPHERLKNVMGWVPRSSTKVGGYPPFFISNYLWVFGLQESCSKSMRSGRYPKIFLFNLMYSYILARNIFVKNV